MATATAAAQGPEGQGIHVPVGRRRPQQQAAARRDARGVRDGRRRPTCAGRASASSRSSGRRSAAARSVNEKDITFFTRQLATMLRAGVPLLQSFDIVARGHSNARFSRLMLDLKNKVETGSSLSQAFREHPKHFDALYCNLVAGRRNGRHARRDPRPARDLQGKDPRASRARSSRRCSIRSRSSSSRSIVTWVIMVFVIPSFKSVFASFGANLPCAHAGRHRHLRLLRQVVVGDVPGDHRRAFVAIRIAIKRSDSVPLHGPTGCSLKIPIIGSILEKATIARWTRTLQTMFAAGVPLVESLDAVGGASGNIGLHRGHQADPDRRQHRHEPDQRDDEH